MTQALQKVCKTCGENKPTSAFSVYKKQNVLFSTCKACTNVKDMKRKAAAAEKRRNDKNFVFPATKKCSKCMEDKPASAFSKDMYQTSGLQTSCKKCQADLAAKKTAEATPEERDRRLASLKRKNHRFAKRQKALEAEGVPGVWGRAARAARKALRRVLLATGQTKTGRTEELLGYSTTQLHLRLETNFKPGMTWANSGKEWHVDHTIPISHFLSRGETRPQIINALCNLRPLWASENLAKNNKLPHFLERKQNA